MQETSRYYDIAYHFAMYTNRSLFLTGKAGTGKTTFLKRLKEQTKKEMAIVAPTGVAAINAGGVTLHSFFQLPFSPFIPTEENKRELLSKLKMSSSRRRLLYDLELLVIDEISMVRADVLDEVDAILRHFRYKKNEPFGGVQVIFIGDMYQLAPVYKDDEWQLLSPYYDSMYFFDSKVIKEGTPVYIEFDKIFRQRDMEFIELLNEVRNNQISERSYKLLQSLYKPNFRPSENDSYITLTTHNYIADGINDRELKKLKGESQKFEAVINGDYPEKSYPTEKNLELKIGAKVMFLKNDKEPVRRYFNGKIGEVVDFKEDAILIKCSDNDDLISVEREVWRNISYVSSPTTKQIEENVLGTFEQFPLRLAWAITIHKSQGLTFDKAVIDAGKAFAAGQVYVALSRCRSLDGVVLLSEINQKCLQVDQNIVEHGKQKLPIDALDEQLDQSKKEFREKILLSLFDFKTLVGQAIQLMNFVKEKGSSFSEDTIVFLENIKSQLSDIQVIAIKFQKLLQQITSSSSLDEQLLQERISSAADYFSEQLKAISEELKKSPAVTDSKVNAADYNDDLQTIFTSIEEKRHIFTHVKSNFSVEQYYVAKSSLMLPHFNVNSFAGSNQSRKIEARFPILFYQLLDLRKNLCEAAGIPLYMVSSTKGLTELATYLPQTLDDMLSISGFGKVTVAKYGQQFLDVVLDYCQKNGLESLMHEMQTKKERKPREKKEKQVKEKKPNTRIATFDLYKQGLTIDEIAKQRNLAKSTIETHLTQYIKAGEIPLRAFISEENEAKIKETLQGKTLLADVFNSLNGAVSYGEIRMVIASEEGNSTDKWTLT